MSESSDWMVLVAFPKSASRAFPVALSIAEQASRFEVGRFGGSLVHVAGFTPTERDARLALALLDQVAGWKGVFLYSHGDLVRNKWTLIETLTCYLQSCRCSDPTAHCCTMIDDPRFRPVKSFSLRISPGPDTTKPVQIDRYAFPCSLLHRDMQFQHDHPAAFRDQVQAAGVREGRNVCPRFDPDQFKKAGVETYYIDA